MHAPDPASFAPASLPPLGMLCAMLATGIWLIVAT